MITKAQIESADIVFRAERGGWFVVKDRCGATGTIVSSSGRDALIRKHRSALGKYHVQIVNLSEFQVAV